MTLTVTSVDTGGEILGLALSGTAFNGTGTFGNVTGDYLNGNGTGGLGILIIQIMFPTV